MYPIRIGPPVGNRAIINYHRHAIRDKKGRDPVRFAESFLDRK